MHHRLLCNAVETTVVIIASALPLTLLWLDTLFENAPGTGLARCAL